jgi:hypothetical protein
MLLFKQLGDVLVLVGEHPYEFAILSAEPIEHSALQNIGDFVNMFVLVPALLSLGVLQVSQVGLEVVDDLADPEKLRAVDSG